MHKRDQQGDHLGQRMHKRAVRSCPSSNSPARCRYRSKLLRPTEETSLWDRSVGSTTASKMPEGPKPNAVTKPITGAEVKQHGRRRLSCETDVTETTICPIRGEVSATLTAICEEGNHVARGVHKRSEMDLGKYEEHKNERSTASPTSPRHAERGRGPEEETEQDGLWRVFWFATHQRTHRSVRGIQGDEREAVRRVEEYEVEKLSLGASSELDAGRIYSSLLFRQWTET